MQNRKAGWWASLVSVAVSVLAGGCPLTGDGNGNTNGNTNDNTNDNKAVFDDPDSNFSTTDVRDVNDEIIQFDTETDAIIYVADATVYQTGSWPVNGNSLGAGGSFLVRFGTVSGERRAYFTETGPATVCDFVVGGGQFQIFPTTVTVPQE